MGVTDEPLWDGNGGTLDPRKATQRDLLVALHLKVDRVVKDVADLDGRVRKQEGGEFTVAQTSIIGDIFRSISDAGTARRSARIPVFALVVSITALVSSIVLTLTVGGLH